jgi:tankyrase
MEPGDLSDLCSERNPDPDRQTAAIEALLKSGGDINATDKNGVTALHHAVRFRNPAAVETLLKHGAAVNRACKRSGSTPLHRAVTTTGAPGTAGKDKEARQIIQILLSYGADPTIKNKNGKTPADYARQEDIKQLLTQKEPRDRRNR